MFDDVINGLTPLETRYAGVHPRLYFTRERLDRLRASLAAEPWARHLARTLRRAEGGAPLDQGVAWLLTGERRWLDSATAWIDQTLRETRWPRSIREDGVLHGDALFTLGLVYDWLHADLPEALREQVRNRLDACGRMHFVAFATYAIYEANTHAWNIAAHGFANMAVAGMAIYGDAPDVGPWMRFVLEKARTMAEACGPDGVSPEGICYGGFYTEYHLKVLDLVRALLGRDLFAGNRHLQNLPYFYLYSALPTRHLRPGNVHLCFGDGVRGNWYGPEHYLRKLAAEYQNPYAQWLADLHAQKGTTQEGGAFLNSVWHDPAVKPVPPNMLPTLRHFEDKGLVLMRSGWGGDESVMGFRCGPHAGWHALRNYPQCIGGGHMQPDAGSFLLFAEGDWLISDGWYSRKFTAYRNTALVNGIGQTGEPDDSRSKGGDWFECTPLRREKRAPAILRAESTAAFDYVIANPQPAYEPQAGLVRFLRHVVFIKPGCWVLMDELEAAAPATFDLLFHAYGEPFQTDRPFAEAGEGAWVTGGERGRLRITSLLPAGAAGIAELQREQGIGVHRDRDMCMLRLRNTEPVRSAVFVTVLEAYPASGAPRCKPVVAPAEAGELELRLGPAEGLPRFVLRPGRADPAAPAVEWRE